MSNFVNDGQCVAGSRDLTIGGVVYATDDFGWNIDSVELLRTGSTGTPTGRKLIKKGTGGSATLQLATPATVVPAWGASFTVTEGTCYISQVGRTENKDNLTVVPIQFFLAVTGSVVAS